REALVSYSANCSARRCMLSMANQLEPRAPWWLKHKILILTGMALILAASTVIIVTCIILSPAHIHFSITAANSTDSTMDGENGLSFNFTLAVDNPSRRAGVDYREVIVSLQLPSKRLKNNSVPATVNGSMPLYQPRHSHISMAVAAFVEKDLLDLYLKKFYRGHPTLTIMVTALVRFKVGVAYSRLYDITVYCPPVVFFDVFQDGNFSYHFAKGNANCSA
uniref:Late embryogenesis abundant protein LEA-2 subgroup domain-containing protein n=2 Tax=Aegilops tauschii TaxID=37682 RepID=A0A453MK99_AEGTS